MKNLKYLFFLTLIMPVFGTVGLAQSSTADSYMSTAVKYYQEGKYAESLRYLDRLTQMAPGYPGLYEYRGNSNFILKNYREAETDYSRAIEQSLGSGKTVSLATYRAGNMTIVEPSAASGTGTSLAYMYNNRGVARYFLQNQTAALADFNEALRISPGLEIARQNQKLINPDQSGQFVGRGVASTPAATPALHAYSRPASKGTQMKIVDPMATSAEVRSARIVDMQAEGTARKRGNNPLKPNKDFDTRTIGNGGKTYKKVESLGASADYLTIVKVKITKKGTFVYYKLINPERKPLRLSIAPATSKDAFYITDRTGRDHYHMRTADGIGIYPKNTEVLPGKTLKFTVEFDKIRDNLGVVNIIEGEKVNSKAWNFYGVDLTK